MLCEFLTWEMEETGNPRIAHGRVEDLPLTYLGYYARNWVERDWGDVDILRFFALEAVNVVEKHYLGALLRQGTNHAMLDPACPEPISRDAREQFGYVVHDGQFNKRFTEAWGRQFVDCVVPAGGRLTSHRSDVLVPARRGFFFQITRCHLSSGTRDVPRFWTSELEESEFDICDEFRAWGHLMPNESAREFPRDLFGHVPMRWVVRAQNHAESTSDDIALEPLPEWLRPRRSS